MRSLAVLLLWLASPALATPPDIIINAEFSEPTSRYDHGILGDAVEWGAMILSVDKCAGCEGAPQIETVTIRLPETRVFEDIAPRIIAGDDSPTLVMVVETDLQLGARLALYDETGLYAATPFIGRSHRWLAPIGAGDLDGDTWPEIAYIDRPHLTKRLRVWRLQDRKLTLLAEMDGLTNHQIGWDFIPGGLRDCGQGPEMIVADANWQNIQSVTLQGGDLRAQTIGVYQSPASLDAALSCAN